MKTGGILAIGVALAAVAAGIVFLLFRGPDTPDPTIDPGDPSGLTIFYAGERLGYLEPCGCDDALIGGFPRGRSAMLATGRQGGPSLVLENGDLNDDPDEQDRLKYTYQVRALERTDCDALNIGERDLTLGLPFLQEVRATAAFPILSANLVHPEGGAPFQASATITKRVGGTDRRILILGVLADSRAPFVESIGLALRPAREALGRFIQAAGTIDLSVILFHGDVEEAKEAVSGIDGIDLVIATAHDRDKPYEAREEDLPPIVSSGIKGKTLGRLAVGFYPAGPTVGQAAPITLTNRIPDSPEIVPILQEYYEAVRMRGLIDDVALENPPEGGLFVGSEACGECHVEEYERWQETMHYRALETLTEKRREADPECVGCHVVGFGYVSGFANANETPHLGGVGCESCHGVGSVHIANPQRGFGFAGGEKSCLGCHNPENSPDFDFSTYWPRIEHPSAP